MGFVGRRHMAGVIVEVGDSFEITLPSEISKVFPVSAGEKLYIVASRDVLIIRKLPKSPAEKLDELAGNVRFDKDARKRAEEWLLKQMKKVS